MISTTAYFTITDYLTPPYNYFFKQLCKPHDGYIAGILIMVATIFIYLAFLLIGMVKIMIVYYFINVHDTYPSK